MLIVPLVAIAILFVGGCGDKGPKVVKISGIVKYRDGTPVQGGTEKGKAVISFVPDFEKETASGDVPKGASAVIDTEGHFTMTTFKPGDGVIPGKYKVILQIRADPYDPASSLIGEKYEKAETSGLDITVDSPKSDLEYVFDKIR